MCTIEQKVRHVGIPLCLSEIKAGTNSSSRQKGSMTDSSQLKKLTLIILCTKFCLIISTWTNTFYYVQTIFFQKDLPSSRCRAGLGIQLFSALFLYI